jgi:hypothetical protein
VKKNWGNKVLKKKRTFAENKKNLKDQNKRYLIRWHSLVCSTRPQQESEERNAGRCNKKMKNKKKKKKERRRRRRTR